MKYLVKSYCGEKKEITDVVSFKIIKWKKEIEIREECDGRFSENLNKKEFWDFIEDLKKLYDDMI